MRMSVGSRRFLLESSTTEFSIVIAILAVGVIIEYFRRSPEKRKITRADFICLLLMMVAVISCKLSMGFYYSSGNLTYSIVSVSVLGVLVIALLFFPIRRLMRSYKSGEMPEAEKERIRSGLWSLLVFVIICISIAAVIFLLAHFGIIK